MHQVDAGHLLEHLGVQVLQAADTGGRVAQLARFGLGQRDQLGQVARRQVGVDDQGHGAETGFDHGNEVALLVKRQRLVDVWRDGVVDDAAQHQRVAIGRAAGQRGGAQRGARAGLVVDVHRLPQPCRQPLGQQACHRVDTTARWVGRNQRDRFAGPGLRLHEGAGQRGQCGGAERRKQAAAFAAQEVRHGWGFLESTCGA